MIAHLEELHYSEVKRVDAAGGGGKGGSGSEKEKEVGAPYCFCGCEGVCEGSIINAYLVNTLPWWLRKVEGSVDYVS